MADLTFAIADLHGSFDLLEMALAAVEAHAAEDGSRTVVFLGDYVDRGPHSAKIIARLMLPPPAGWQWICLKGNHEEMMCEALRFGFMDHWIRNGGEATLRSFDGSDPEHLVPPAVLEWATQLPLLYIDRRRVFVHAGVDTAVPLDQQDPNDLLWMRDQGFDDHDGRHIVHGHTPHIDGPLLAAGRTDLDTLAWRTGRLVVGVFDDDLPGGPVALIKVHRDRAAIRR